MGSSKIAITLESGLLEEVDALSLIVTITSCPGFIPAVRYGMTATS